MKENTTYVGLDADEQRIYAAVLLLAAEKAPEDLSANTSEGIHRFVSPG